MECSKMGGEMFTMKSGVFRQPFIVNDDLVNTVANKSMKDSGLQFQNFCVNFCKSYVLFSTRLSQLC
jgi:hypothetical protein